MQEQGLLRPSILDFFANYRDLQELGQETPATLYQEVKDERSTSRCPMTRCDLWVSPRSGIGWCKRKSCWCKPNCQINRYGDPLTRKAEEALGRITSR